MAAITPEKLAEMEQDWAYVFSIPPGEVKQREWWQTATELRAEVERLRAVLVEERARHLHATIGPGNQTPGYHTVQFWDAERDKHDWYEQARTALVAEGRLPAPGKRVPG